MQLAGAVLQNTHLRAGDGPKRWRSIQAIVRPTITGPYDAGTDWTNAVTYAGWLTSETVFDGPVPRLWLQRQLIIEPKAKIAKQLDLAHAVTEQCMIEYAVRVRDGLPPVGYAGEGLVPIMNRLLVARVLYGALNVIEDTCHWHNTPQARRIVLNNSAGVRDLINWNLVYAIGYRLFTGCAMTVDIGTNEGAHIPQEVSVTRFATPDRAAICWANMVALAHHRGEGPPTVVTGDLLAMALLSGMVAWDQGTPSTYTSLRAKAPNYW